MLRTNGPVHELLADPLIRGLGYAAAFAVVETVFLCLTREDEAGRVRFRPNLGGRTTWAGYWRSATAGSRQAIRVCSRAGSRDRPREKPYDWSHVPRLPLHLFGATMPPRSVRRRARGRPLPGRER